MTGKIIVEGITAVSERLRLTREELNRVSRGIVLKGGAIVADSAKEQFRARPPGSRRVAGSGRIYYAGAPDFPAVPPNPTTRTGNLKRSIRVLGAARLGVGRWGSDTGPTVKYAPYVEYGTSRSREFPYMRSGLDNAEERLKRLYEEEWRKVFH